MSDPLTDLLDEWDRYEKTDNDVLAEHIYGWLRDLRKPESYPCPECGVKPGVHCWGVRGAHLRRTELMQKTFYQVIGMPGWEQR